MSAKEKEFTTELKSWRVTAKLLREINIECAKRDLTHYELADLAWETYKRARFAKFFAPGPSEPSDRGAFLHWLLDRLLAQTDNPYLDAIEGNLLLIAFGFFAVEGRPVEDLRGMLIMLFENDRKSSPKKK